VFTNRSGDERCAERDPDLSRRRARRRVGNGLLSGASPGNKGGRVTMAGEVTEFSLPAGSLPGPIVAGADGALWLTLRNAGELARMTTDGQLTGQFPLASATADPVGLVAAPDGQLWVGQHETASLVRFSLAGEFGAELRVRSRLDVLTLGPDGALWYATADGAKVGRALIDR
jgi:virginiamycin B lyase